MTNKALEIKAQAEVPTVAKMDSLIEWVVQAPVEEVCWRVTELGSMRQWLKAQKESTELRIKAVRLELIALRKVAAGGLAHKISGAATLRASAKWLAGLTDEEFATVISELDGDRTPIALYQRDRAQRDAMREALRDKSGDSALHEAWLARRDVGGLDEAAERRRSAATYILREVIEEGEPFTVSEAAERLADAMGLDVEVRRETSEGLREMIRTSIRRGDRTLPVDEWSDLPIAFTSHLPSGEYVRVPATRATIQHLQDHWYEVNARAVATTRHAEKLASMLDQVTHRAMESAGLDPFNDDKEEVLGLHLAPVIDGIRRSSDWRASVDEAAA